MCSQFFSPIPNTSNSKTICLNNSTFKLSVSNLKNSLRHVQANIEALEQLKTSLHLELNNPCDWHKKLKEVEAIRTQINALLTDLSTSFMKKIKYAIKKRTRKRKLQRIRKKALIDQIAQKRMLIEKKINENLNQVRNKQSEISQTKQIENQKELLLVNINKKITDAHSYIKTFAALRELRKYRQQQSNKKGLGDTRFEQSIQKLEIVWQNALAEYETAKQNLLTMITKKDTTWSDILFGEDNCVLFLENFNSFLDTRRTWDSYLVPLDSGYGSAIPNGWILPNENPTEKWSCYKREY